MLYTKFYIEYMIYYKYINMLLCYVLNFVLYHILLYCLLLYDIILYFGVLYYIHILHYRKIISYIFYYIILYVIYCRRKFRKSNFRQYGQMKSRDGKSRREKMQMREKVGKSRNTLFFQ